MRVFRLFAAALLAVIVPLEPVLAQSGLQLTGTPQHIFTNSVATIRGTALTARNNPLTDARVRLRNARTGRIVGLKITDQAGLFEFVSVEPGSYIVELVTSRDEVLAASDMLNPNGGDVVSAIVKLPYEIPAGGVVLFGHVNTAALIVTATAAAAGLLATVATGQDVSPRR